ncbi:MAG: metal-sensitive transcriptional regulator [Acidimicrobiales bacterium]
MTVLVEEPATHECSGPSAPGSSRAVCGYASRKDDYLARLRKIAGQVGGLQKTIEDDRWWPDVVTQVASATRALRAAVRPANPQPTPANTI